MKTTINLKMLVGCFCMLFFLSSCKNETKNETMTSQTEKAETGEVKKQGQAFIKDDESTPNVLNIAIGSSDHTTLVAAVQAADLENALVNAGPLMVFAPTNEAFDALPPGTVEDLLKPENKNALANILKHHVTPGNYSKNFLKKFKKLGQANNQNTTVEVKGEDVYVGGAKIVASIPAGNGIVHVVDKVILPPSGE
ncbi:fasciclin domain-containing protein [Ulvibacterium marinum]|uniref:fasciclin domain-containing protein n=1 Tax=Ulvibacterium marinum TaxID=2419782 RepID=UPI00249474FF|nr:fasciclin domain-containing protein [Ulvibacterium marinum]